MSKASPPKPELHLAQLERKIKEKEEELAFLSSDLPTEIKKLKSELAQKNKQIEDLSASSLQAELTKLKAYTEDLKKLEITKDLQISKLNDQLQFKDRDLDRLNQVIKDNKPIDVNEKEREMTALHQQEASQLNQKITDLELRIYKLNEDKKELSLENFKLQEKLTHLTEEQGHCLKQEEEEKEKGNELEESTCVPKDTYNALLEDFELIQKQLDAAKAQHTFLQTQCDEQQLKITAAQQEAEFALTKVNDFKGENELLRKEIEELAQSHRERSSANENQMKDIKYIKAKHEAELNRRDKEHQAVKDDLSKQVNDLSKLVNDYMLKAKELELVNRNLSVNLKQVIQGKSDLEEVILKQEEKVSDLGEKVNKIDQMLKDKNSELKQNESYSLQLINIINEQKKQIAAIRSSQKETENNELILFQNQINTLKTTIEVRDVTINQLQQKHKYLQERYTKISAERRMKPQEELLKEAKEMKQNKIDKEMEKVRNRSSNKVKRPLNNQTIEENKVIPEVLPPQIIPKPKKPKSPINQQQPPMLPSSKPSKASDSTLPLILSEKPLRHMNSLNSVEDAKMDEISNMMRKIIDEF